LAGRRARTLRQEGQVVGGVDDEDLLGVGGEALHVGHGADGAEDLADLVLREAGLLEGGADVARALAGPDDVAEPGGGVVEGADLQARVVRGGDEGVAGAEAGSEDAELFVALGFEPVEQLRMSTTAWRQAAMVRPMLALTA
jgi:hypothetical protein